MTTRRPDREHSRALLIGVGTYDHTEHLPHIPAAAHNLTDLNGLLTGDDGVLNPDNCWTVLDPAGSAHLGDLVEQAAEQATDTLLVYYTGHGLLDRRGRLHLALTGTHPGRTSYTALPFSTLRESILESPAATRILILDCCFSGRAFDALTDGPDAILGQADIAGTYTITSSARNEPSYAPTGHRNTAFTGALIAAATRRPGLALDDLYIDVLQHLIRHGHPRPECRAVDTAGRLVLFPNNSRSPSPENSTERDDTAVRRSPNPAQVSGGFRNRQRDWSPILSKPLPQAAAEVRRSNAKAWTSRSEADVALADILSSIDQREIDEVDATLFERTTQILPGFHLAVIGSAGFAVHHPVAVLDGTSSIGKMSRLVTVDRTGLQTTLYEGPAQHWSICALDSETVVARREFDNGGWRGDTEIVEYTPNGETVLANGAGLLDAVVEATATGFVIGTKLAGSAFALSNGQQEVLDLRQHGFRRADLFGVDGTGERIVFADGYRLLVTDSGLRPLYEGVVESLPHGEISAVAFAGDSIVTAGYDKGLYRWQVIGGRLRGLHSSVVRQPRTFFRLNPVTQWGLLNAEGGNVNYHYDLAELEPRQAPAFLVPSSVDSEGDEELRAPNAIGKFLSSAYGRLAVYEGGLASSLRNDVHGFYSTVVQDLDHPLNTLLKPLGTLGPDDAERVGRHLSGADATYSLTDSERAVLDALVRACQWVSQV